MVKQLPLAGRDHAMIWGRFPGDPDSSAVIRNFLRNNENDPDMPNRPNYGDFKEVKANGAGDDGSDWTVLFFVQNMKDCHLAQLKRNKFVVAEAYGIYDNNQNGNSDSQKGIDSDGDGSEDDGARTRIQRREVMQFGPEESWELSQISVAPGESWESTWSQNMVNGGHKMTYDADESFGQGQTIFVLEDEVPPQHPEFKQDFFLKSEPMSRPKMRALPEFEWDTVQGATTFNGKSNIKHSIGVASKAAGWRLGLAKKAQIIIVHDRSGLPADPNNMLWERHLEKWVRVYNEVKRMYASDASQRGKIIVTTSYGFVEEIHAKTMRYTMMRRWRKYPLSHPLLLYLSLPLS